MYIDYERDVVYNIDTVKGTTLPTESQKGGTHHVKGQSVTRQDKPLFTLQWIFLFGSTVGYIRANAMATAWKLVRYRALKAKVSGTSFDNRSVTRLDIFIRNFFHSIAAGRAVNKPILQN